MPVFLPLKCFLITFLVQVDAGSFAFPANRGIICQHIKDNHVPGIISKAVQIHIFMAAVFLRTALSRISSINWPTVLRSGMARTFFPSPLALYGQDAIQGSGGDPQAVGSSDVILHRLVNAVAADYQHMRPSQVIPCHIQPVLMFLGNLVLEEGGQEQHRQMGEYPASYT